MIYLRCFQLVAVMALWAVTATAQNDLNMKNEISTTAKERMTRMFPQAEKDWMKEDPEFVERFANFTFDEVVAQTEKLLDSRTRHICYLATLLGCQGIDAFKAILPEALRQGVSPIEVKEIVYQATAYLGMGRVMPFLNAANEVLKAEGVQLPLAPQAQTSDAKPSGKGLRGAGGLLR